MLRTPRFCLAFALSLSLLAGSAVPNASADSSSSDNRVKMHRAKLRSAMLKSRDNDSSLEACQSGNLEIGTVQVERGARVPSEITVLVDGDVINLNDGRGSHVCR